MVVAHRTFALAWLAAVALAASCKIDPERTRYCLESEESGQCHALRVSIDTVISRSNEFHGKRVKISGYAHVAVNNSGIYSKKSDFEEWRSKRGLWLDVPAHATDPVDHLVEVEGTFDKSDKGYLENWAGAIKHIFRIKKLD